MPGKYRPGACDAKWDALARGAVTKPLTAASLWRALKDENAALFEELQQRQRARRTPPPGPRFVDDEEPPEGRGYDSVVARVERSWFKLSTTAAYCQVLLSGEVRQHKRNEMAVILENVSYLEPVRDNAGEPLPGQFKTMPFVTRWTRSPAIRTYDRIDFLPPGAPLSVQPVVGERVYNLFRGFAADATPSPMERPAGLDVLIAHLKCVCGGDDKTFQFVRNTLAHQVQSPGDKQPLLLVVVGEQGCGKDLMFAAHGRALGAALYVTTENAGADVLGSFNSEMMNKLLVHLQELNLSQTGGDSMDRWKGLLTMDRAGFMAKYGNKVRVHNPALYVATTNHIASVPLEDGQRRVVIIRASAEHVGDTAYFAKVAAASETAVVQRAWLDYLRSVDLSEFNPRDHVARPVTDAQREAEQKLLSPVVRFLEWIATPGGGAAALGTGAADIPAVVGPSVSARISPDKAGATAVVTATGQVVKAVRYTPTQLYDAFALFVQEKRLVKSVAEWGHKRFGDKLTDLCGGALGKVKGDVFAAEKGRGHGVTYYAVDPVRLRAFLDSKGWWSGDFAEWEVVTPAAPAGAVALAAVGSAVATITHV